MSHVVLIIDDDPATRLLLSRYLEMEGYETTCAANGAEAVHRLVEQQPSVVLLDYDMPVMDGHDFHEVQKRIAPAVPIVCITGSDTPELSARVVGAARVHPKPFRLDSVSASVRERCAASPSKTGDCRAGGQDVGATACQTHLRSTAGQEPTDETCARATS